MCGLFGLARTCDVDPGAATRMLIHLGLFAEERGIDGAGLALGVPGPAARVPANAALRGNVRAGLWRVVKQPGRFRHLWRPDLADDLATASLVLGHTRWATQGDAGLLSNTSPLVVGDVVGTHNGDIDAEALRILFDLTGPRVGQTDTAVLLSALDAAGDDAAAVLQVLTAVVGRAALAWSPLTGDRQLWLARGGLCPLAVARDEAGNLFWASNPRWLTRAAAAAGVRLRAEPAVLPAGLLTRIVRVDGAPSVDGWWQFKPTVRKQDLRIATVAAWRGFTPADRALDRARLRHRVHRPVAGCHPPRPVPVAAATG
jgi:hypothetical protein